MVKKELLCPMRTRRVPKQFSWVDQELVRGGYAKRVSAEALGLYMFLITVGDLHGLSYYSDRTISAQLSLDEARLDSLRTALIRADLIAYKKPLYQVLSLDRQPPASPLAPSSAPRAGGGPYTVVEVLRSIVNRST